MKVEDILTAPISDVNKQLDEQLRDVLSDIASPLPENASKNITSAWTNASYTQQTQPQQVEEFKDDTDLVVDTIKQSAKNNNFDVSDDDIYTALYKAQGGRKPPTTYQVSTPKPITQEQKQSVDTIKGVLGYSKIDNPYTYVGILDSRLSTTPPQIKSPNGFYDPPAYGYIKNTFGIELSTPHQKSISQEIIESNETLSNLNYSLQTPVEIATATAQPTTTTQVNVTQPNDNFNDEPLISKAVKKSIDMSLNALYAIGSGLSIVGSTITRTILAPIAINEVKVEANRINNIVDILKSGDSGYKFVVTSSPLQYNVDNDNKTITIGQTSFLNLMDELGKYGFVNRDDAVNLLWNTAKANHNLNNVELKFSDVFGKSDIGSAMKAYSEAPISDPDEVKNLDNLYTKGIWGHSTFDIFDFINKAYGTQRYPTGTQIGVSLLTDIFTDPLVFLSPVKGARVIAKAGDYILDGTDLFDKAKRAVQVAWLSQTMTHDEYEVFKLLGNDDVKNSLNVISASDLLKTYITEKKLDPSTLLGYPTLEELLGELRDSANKISDRLTTINKDTQEMASLDDFISNMGMQLNQLTPDDFLNTEKIKTITTSIDDAIKGDEYNIVNALNDVIDNEVEHLSSKYKLNPERLSSVIDKLQQASILDTITRSTRYQSLPVEFFKRMTISGADDLVSFDEFMKTFNKYKDTLLEIDDMTSDNPQSVLRKSVFNSIGLTGDTIEDPSKLDVIKINDSSGNTHKFMKISRDVYKRWKLLVKNLNASTDLRRILNSPDIANIVYISNNKYTLYNLMGQLATFGDMREMKIGDITKQIPVGVSADTTIGEMMTKAVSDDAIAKMIDSVAENLPSDTFSSQMKAKVASTMKALITPDISMKDITPIEKEYNGRKVYRYPVQVGRLLKMDKSSIEEMMKNEGEDFSEEGAERVMSSKISEPNNFQNAETGMILEMTKGLRKRYMLVDFIRDVKDQASIDTLVTSLRNAFDKVNLPPEDKALLSEYITKAYNTIDNARNEIINKASELIDNFKNSDEAKAILMYAYRTTFKGIEEDPKITKKVNEIENIIKGEITAPVTKQVEEKKPIEKNIEENIPPLLKEAMGYKDMEDFAQAYTIFVNRKGEMLNNTQKLEDAIKDEIKENGDPLTQNAVDNELKGIKEEVKKRLRENSITDIELPKTGRTFFFIKEGTIETPLDDEYATEYFADIYNKAMALKREEGIGEETPQEVNKLNIESNEQSVENAVANSIKGLVINNNVDVLGLAKDIVVDYETLGKGAILDGIRKIYLANLQGAMEEEMNTIRNTLVNNADLFLIPSKEVVRRLYSEFDEALRENSVVLSILGKDVNRFNRLMKSVREEGFLNYDDLQDSIDKIINSESKSKNVDEAMKKHIFNFPLWLISNKDFKDIVIKAKNDISNIVSQGLSTANLMRDRGVRDIMNIMKTSKTMYRLPSISLWNKGLTITPNKNVTKYLIPAKTSRDEVEQMMNTILEVKSLNKLDKMVSFLNIGRDEIIKYTRGVQALMNSIIPKTLNEKAKTEVNFLRMVMNSVYSELSNVFRNKTNELNLQIGHTLTEVERALKEALRPLVSVNVVKNRIVDIAKKAVEKGKLGDDVLELAKEIEKTDFGDIKALHIITAITDNTDIFANAFMNGKKSFAELFETDFLKNAKNTKDLMRLISEHDGGRTLTMMGEALRQRLKMGIQGGEAKNYILDPSIKPLDYIAFYSAIGKKDGDDIIEGLKGFSKTAELAIKTNATDEFDKLMSYFLKPADTLFIKTYGTSIYADVVNKILHRTSEMDNVALDEISGWMNKLITDITKGTSLYIEPEATGMGEEYYRYIFLKKNDDGRGIFYRSPEYRMLQNDTELSMKLFNTLMTTQAPPVIEALKKDQQVLTSLIPRIISSKEARTQIELVRETETGVKKEMNIDEILSEIEDVEKEFAVGVSTQEANIYHMLLSSATQSMPLFTFAKTLGFNNDTHAVEFLNSLIGKEGELGIKIKTIEEGGEVVITDKDLDKFESEVVNNIKERIKKPMKLERIFVQNTLLAIAHKMALKQIIKNTKSFLMNPSVSKTLLIFGRSAMEYKVGGITEISKKMYIPIKDIVKNNENIKIIENQITGSETPLTMSIINNPLYLNAVITASKYSKDPTGLIRASIAIYKDYMQKVYKDGVNIVVDGNKKTIKGMDAVINAMKIFYPDTVSNKVGDNFYKSSFLYNMKRLAEDYLKSKYKIEDTSKVTEDTADKIITDLWKKGKEIDTDNEYLLLKLRERRNIPEEQYQKLMLSRSGGEPSDLKGLNETGIFNQITRDENGNPEKNIWDGITNIVGYIFAKKRGLDFDVKSYPNELRYIFTNANSLLEEVIGKGFKNELPDINIWKDFENYITTLNEKSIMAIEYNTKIPVGVAMPITKLKTLYDLIKIMNPYKDVGIYTYEKLIKEVKNLILPFLDIEAYSKVMGKVAGALGVLRRSLITWFPSFYLQNLIDSITKHILAGGSLSSVVTATSFLLNKYIDGGDEKLTNRAAKEIMNTEWNNLASDKKIIVRFVDGDEKTIPFEDILKDIVNDNETTSAEVASIINKNITDIIGPRLVKEIELNYNEEGRNVSKILNSYDMIYNGYSLSDLYELASSLRVFNVGITLSISQDTLRDDINLLMQTYFNRMTKVGEKREGIMKDLNKAKTILFNTIREMNMQKKVLIRLNGTVEQIARFSTFIDSIAEKGHSIPEALRRIDTWHFDYSTISKIEKKYINDIFFFWTFFRKTFELGLRMATTKQVLVGHLIKSRYDMNGEAMGLQGAYLIPIGITTQGGIPKLQGIGLDRTFSVLFPLALAMDASDSLENTIKKILLIKPAVDKQLEIGSRGLIKPTIPEHALDYTDALMQMAVDTASPFIEQIVSMSNPLIKLGLLLGGYSLNFGQIKQIKNNGELFYFFGTWLPVSELTASVFSSVVRRNVFFGGVSLESFLFPVSIRAKKIQEVSKKDISQMQAGVTTDVKRMLTSLVSKETNKDVLRRTAGEEVRRKLIQGLSDLTQQIRQYKQTADVIKNYRRIINE